MSRDSDRVRLQHMLDAAGRAVQLIKGRTRTDLDEDDVLVLALTRLVEIIGEASKFVSSSTRDALPDVPWKQIAGTRENLVHGYFNVDLNVLRSIASEDLPALIPRLRASLESHRLR